MICNCHKPVTLKDTFPHTSTSLTKNKCLRYPYKSAFWIIAFTRTHISSHSIIRGQGPSMLQISDTCRWLLNSCILLTYLSKNAQQNTFKRLSYVCNAQIDMLLSSLESILKSWKYASYQKNIETNTGVWNARPLEYKYNIKQHAK